MNSNQEKSNEFLDYLNTITAGNPGPAIEHLKNINGIMSSSNKDKVSKLANTTLDYLKSKPNGEGEKNITKMCEMNKTVMPYIVDHYNQTGKNEENRVTVYNKMNEEHSFWYNFFYGIIFGIEKNLNEKASDEGSSKIKLDKKSLQEIQSNLAGLCKNVQLKKGGKLMTGGWNVQLFGVLIFGFASVVAATLPSQALFVPKYDGMEQGVGEVVIEYGAKAIPVGSGIAAVGAVAFGEGDLAMNIVEFGFKAEAAIVGADFVNKYFGLTDEEKREKFGEIANLAANDLREFVNTGKDMVSESNLITETLNKQIQTKTIMVDGKVINPQSTEGKAIQNAFRFINGQYEVKVFSEEYSKYVAEWKKYSAQSTNPARDDKGILMGNVVSYDDVASKGVEFTNKLEANYKKVANDAGLDVNDIQHLSNIMSEFEDLYFSNQITISEDTLNLMMKLSNAMNKGKDGGILDIFKDNNLADKNKQDWNDFKGKIDKQELNVNMSWMVWFMRHAIKFGLATVLITTYVNSNRNSNNKRTWTQWFKSWVSSSETEGSSATGGKRRTKTKKNKKRKTKKNHKRRNKIRLK